MRWEGREIEKGRGMGGKEIRKAKGEEEGERYLAFSLPLESLEVGLAVVAKI